ncbi:hypothetical protein ANCCAN_12511 [Ancylostoma caninum]|uniref:Uncharacterized protein n=1 Tax=Ancylostoma caninum TaxID=29170 RepID=A0A368GAT3_ANCCA|nr:hypothetical protein ANCCAN_12511 [Ancylostoma caninum]
MTKTSEKQLLETLMEILLVPVIIAVSVVCYVLITRYFRNVSGYTEKVKQMQARFSTSIYLQGVIHCVFAVAIALLVPLTLLVTAITDDDGVIFRFALFFELVSFETNDYYSSCVI